MKVSDDEILALVDEKGSIANREVADAHGLSSQAVAKRLRSLVDRGLLVPVGEGRARRYERPSEEIVRDYATPGLEESRVWEELRATDAVATTSEAAQDVLGYAVTELVNNAIDHSGSDRVIVRLRRDAGALVVEVEDRGEGAFAHLRRELGLDSELHALQEVIKGKVTTMPERHSGEGLFFVSKVVERFLLESGSLRYLVDNQREDFAVGDVEPPRRGTLARVTVDPERPRDLSAVFAEYTEDYEFVRTRTVVELYGIGVRFISRSEAKRLMHGLEKFREVVLDFRGVRMVGQGFADEVFRVWARQHPQVELIPREMSPAVELMVERARRAATARG